MFLDEIDQFALDRQSDRHSTRTLAILVAFLAALDGLVPAAGPILIAATTAMPCELDDALLRAGRLGFRVRFDLPDVDERLALLRLFLRDRPVDPSIKLERVARLATIFTPADLRQSGDDAIGLALAGGRRNRPDTPTTSDATEASSMFAPSSTFWIRLTSAVRDWNSVVR